MIDTITKIEVAIGILGILITILTFVGLVFFHI